MRKCVLVACVLVVLSLAQLTTEAVARPPVAAPRVEKIEPPNWWIGLAANPMLLLTGHDLQGARVTTKYHQVRVLRTESSANGHYLLVWLQISPGAVPGRVPLRITSSAGATTITLPLDAVHNPQGNFQGLSPDDVIYLIMPDRFADGDPSNNEPAPQLHTYNRNQPKAWHGGDLQGIRQHLSYLRDLGVTALWLTPFWQNDWRADDFSYHGYHVEDFYKVDQHLGTLADLQALVAEAHRLGMKLVLDYVVNHVGPHHPWADDPPQPGWIHGTPAHHANAEYQFNGLVDPHASLRQYINVLDGWFGNKLPDLNPDNPQLARYLLEDAEWWMESAGLDAFRLDTFPYSSRRFWSGWHEGILRAYPHATTIGEVWERDVTITSFFEGGRKQFDGVDTGLTTVFDFPLQFALRDVVIRKQPVQKIIDVLQRDWLYPRPELLVTFLGNHDTKRFLSEENSSRQKLKAAFSLLLTLRGIPQLYYGDEIGMQGGDDPDNRRDFPGGFRGDARNAFQPDQRTPEEQEIFSRVQRLVQLRRDHPALRGGRQWHIGWNENYYAFLRESPGERLLVLFNNADTPSSFSVPLADTPLENARALVPLLDAQPARVHAGNLELVVAPVSVAVYQVR